jgi:hypothetical protein
MKNIEVTQVKVGLLKGKKGLKDMLMVAGE